MIPKKKTKFTTNPSSDREKKNLLFLNLIQKHKPTSRSELSKLTDINAVTVSNYINGYLKKGLILERGYDISSGGRRPELIELNKGWGYGIGISVCKDRIKGVLADLDMEVLTDGSIEGYARENLKSFIDEILKKLLDSSKIDKTQVKHIGIGVSGDVLADIIKVKDLIETETGVPVLIAESALCAAFGEKSLNPDVREAGRFIYIFGDVGQGVFINNNEFFEPGDDKNGYAYLKSWGQGLSIANEAKTIVERGMGTNIIDIAGGAIERITLETVIKATAEHDEMAVDLVKMAGMNLGVRIAYLINLFEPEVIIIGGGIEKAGNVFFDPLKASIDRFILRRMLDKVRLVPAILGEDACVKGGASLAIRETFIEI
ncbi:MAG: hypothetical protein A2Z72_05965 [Omnitrophica bacterium RBG_13_46_9]|nr:MAG: hypothetical protein A2Z72_05965 [Omnitrophica bacterium RBG_13_46_9]